MPIVGVRTCRVVAALVMRLRRQTNRRDLLGQRGHDLNESTPDIAT
jgi:hypothetical protein